MTIAKALLVIWLVGTIGTLMIAVIFSLRRPRNYDVSFGVDVTSRFISSVFLSVFWPIEIGRSLWAAIEFQRKTRSW